VKGEHAQLRDRRQAKFLRGSLTVRFVSQFVTALGPPGDNLTEQQFIAELRDEGFQGGIGHSGHGDGS
jgi:hypothetical protein